MLVYRVFRPEYDEQHKVNLEMYYYMFPGFYFKNGGVEDIITLC